MHAKGQLHGLEAGVEAFLAGVLIEVALVEEAGEGKLGALGTGGDVLAGEVGDELALGVGFDVGALIDSGQESAGPIARLSGGHARGHEDDVAGEVLAFGAEAVEEPRADTGPFEHGMAAVHHQQAG